VYMIKSIITLACLMPLVGCTILKSSGIIERDMDIILDYRLPKALLPVKLQRSRSGTDAAPTIVYAVEIGLPRYLGDTQHTYVLDYKTSPLASDEFTVKVHPQERVLTSIKMTTDDKTGEIIVKIAETVAAFEESPAVSTAETLLDIEIDPSDNADITFAANALKNLSGGVVSTFEIPNQQLSTSLKDSELDKKGCRSVSGICYRLPVKYYVRFGFNDGRVFSRSISLPNAGPIVPLNLSRAVFVEKVHEISLTDGSPAEMKLKKPSEGLEIVSLPLEIAKAILQAPAEILQLKINQNDKEKELANSKNEKIKAQAELAKTLAARGKGIITEDSTAASNLVFLFGASGPWANIPPADQKVLPPGPGVDGSPGTGPDNQGGTKTENNPAKGAKESKSAGAGTPAKGTKSQP
jgi:hypothetical protein